MIIFESKIVSIGLGATEFFNHGILVLFRESCPSELRDVSIIHAPGKVSGSIEVGDHLVIGKTSYLITAIGDVVNLNLEQLGHLVVKFNDRKAPELPGDLCVEGKFNPLLLYPGQLIRIERRL